MVLEFLPFSSFIPETLLPYFYICIIVSALYYICFQKEEENNLLKTLKIFGLGTIFFISLFLIYILYLNEFRLVSDQPEELTKLLVLIIFILMSESILRKALLGKSKNILGQETPSNEDIVKLTCIAINMPLIAILILSISHIVAISIRYLVNMKPNYATFLGYHFGIGFTSFLALYFFLIPITVFIYRRYNVPSKERHIERVATKSGLVLLGVITLIISIIFVYNYNIYSLETKIVTYDLTTNQDVSQTYEVLINHEQHLLKITPFEENFEGNLTEGSLSNFFGVQTLNITNNTKQYKLKYVKKINDSIHFQLSEKNNLTEVKINSKLLPLRSRDLILIKNYRNDGLTCLNVSINCFSGINRCMEIGKTNTSWNYICENNFIEFILEERQIIKADINLENSLGIKCQIKCIE